MASVQPCELPLGALLRRCEEEGAYADCYVAEVGGLVSQATFVEAFYTTTLFKIERIILGRLASRPSTDIEAKQLAEGTMQSFAAWRVESRTSDQLLLADFTGRTKSWLMVVPVMGATEVTGTRLYFGSAVIPKSTKAGGRRLGFAFHALLGFHRLYSRRLLTAARARVLTKQIEIAS